MTATINDKFNNPRIKWLDIAKGIGIILVVFGHVVTNGITSNLIDKESTASLLTNTIYLFHMPLFFFISGYLFKLKDEFVFFDNYRNCLKKILSLFVPYTVFSFIYFGFKYVFSNSSAVNNPVGFDLLINSWKNPIGEYWFLYSLILFTILGFSISFLFSYIKSNICKNIFLIAITLAFASVNLKNDFFIPYVCLGIKRSLPFFFFFFLSVTVHRLVGENKLINKQSLIFIIPLIILGFFNMNIQIIRLLSVVLIIWSILIFSSMINSKILENFGKLSLPIYLMHVYFVVLFKVIIIKIGLSMNLLTILVDTILSLYFPIFIYKLAIKFKPTDFIYNPKKYVFLS